MIFRKDPATCRDIFCKVGPTDGRTDENGPGGGNQDRLPAAGFLAIVTTSSAADHPAIYYSGEATTTHTATAAVVLLLHGHPAQQVTEGGQHHGHALVPNRLEPKVRFFHTGSSSAAAAAYTITPINILSSAERRRHRRVLQQEQVHPQGGRSHGKK